MRVSRVLSGHLGFVLCAVFNSFAGSHYYEVVNVTPGDSLNIRSEPTHRSSTVGRIPHDATEVTWAESTRAGRGNMWMKIRYAKMQGWVNASFLQRVKPALFQETLNCFGAEPHWAVTVTHDSLCYKSIDGNEYRYALQEIHESLNHTDTWAISVQTPKGFAPAVFVIDQECSDDMSDFRYKYRLLMFDPVTGEALSGCCNRMGEP